MSQFVAETSITNGHLELNNIPSTACQGTVTHTDPCGSEIVDQKFMILGNYGLFRQSHLIASLLLRHAEMSPGFVDGNPLFTVSFLCDFVARQQERRQ